MSAVQLALTITRTVCRPTRAGSDSGSIDRSSRPGARTGPGNLAGGFWTARVLEKLESTSNSSAYCLRYSLLWARLLGSRPSDGLPMAAVEAGPLVFIHPDDDDGPANARSS